MTTQTEAERLAQWLLDNYEADEIDLAANLLRKQRADIEQLERLLKTSANSERRQQAEIERLNKAPDYAWPTIADYEKEVGLKVNDAFRMGWAMARTTNGLFKQMGSDT